MIERIILFLLFYDYFLEREREKKMNQSKLYSSIEVFSTNLKQNYASIVGRVVKSALLVSGLMLGFLVVRSYLKQRHYKKIPAPAKVG